VNPFPAASHLSTFFLPPTPAARVPFLKLVAIFAEQSALKRISDSGHQQPVEKQDTDCERVFRVSSASPNPQQNPRVCLRFGSLI
jgi:hypothetical protein